MGKANLENLKIANLTTLGMPELWLADSFATELLVTNHQTLRHLRIGVEMDLVVEYADNRFEYSNEVVRTTSLTECFANFMQKKFATLKETSTPVVRLESLSLIGLNLHVLTNGSMEPGFDFNNLSMLTLESCCLLEEAIPLLMGIRDGRRKVKSALRLHTLAIRHETTNYNFSQVLEEFLLSLKPLTHLHVLLEGRIRDSNMEKILRVHGQCLRSFIWDTRIGPKLDALEDLITLPKDHELLEIVARHCPGLKALGISLDWADITESEKHHKKVKVVLELCTHRHADFS